MPVTGRGTGASFLRVGGERIFFALIDNYICPDCFQSEKEPKVDFK